MNFWLVRLFIAANAILSMESVVAGDQKEPSDDTQFLMDG